MQTDPLVFLTRWSTRFHCGLSTRSPQIHAKRYGSQTRLSCRRPFEKTSLRCCLSGTPQDRACAALAVSFTRSPKIRSFCSEFLCRTPTTLPVGSGPVVGTVRLPLQIDGLRARTRQAITRCIMKGPAVVDFPEGNVETFASEDANEKTLRVATVTHSRPPSLSFPTTERPER